MAELIGECMLMGDRTPEFADFVNEGQALVLIEIPRDRLRDCGALLFKTVRVSIADLPDNTPRDGGENG